MTIQDKPIIHGRDHLEHGPDPIPGIGDGFLGSGVDPVPSSPDGFWKLNEDSGSTAHDSSGNGNHMTTDTAHSWLAPQWGQAAGPPGEQSANFGAIGRRVDRTHAVATGDLSAGAFVLVTSDRVHAVIGHGPYPVRTGGNGWGLYVLNSGNQPILYTNDGSGGPATLLATDALTFDVWAHVAVVLQSGTWTLYVNGVAQASTLADTSTDPVPAQLWLGNDGGSNPQSPSDSANFYLNGAESYAGYWTRALTAAEVSTWAGFPGSEDAGLVPTSDGAGSWSWQKPTVEVQY